MTTQNQSHRTREYQQIRRAACEHCQSGFNKWNRSQRYCSERCRTDASTARRIRRPGHWLLVPVKCGICGTDFFRTPESSPNRKYCSPECAIRGRLRNHLRFRELHPNAMAAYNRTRVQSHGRDTLITRLRKRYPDLPTVCEVPTCSESRVLDIAHKPKYKRNGSWRTLDKYKRHMFWMLCPTCHRVLDLKIETPRQMGLIGCV